MALGSDPRCPGLLKAAAGIAAGGLVGAVLFRSGGRGWRSACVAAGAGVAAGSTYQRVKAAASPALSSAAYKHQ
jgi:hypothetical protein